MDGECITDRRQIFRTVRKMLIKRCTRSLRGHPYQGKKNYLIAAAKLSSSHFFLDERYSNFIHWRFVHRATLGLTTKLNEFNFNKNPKYQKWRKCGKDENLLHMFDHCIIHSILYNKRLIAVFERIKRLPIGDGPSLAKNKLQEIHVKDSPQT